MARATRSKQVALVSLNSDTKSKRTTRMTSITKADKKSLDANPSPPIKSGRVSKNSQPKASELKSKVHAVKKDPLIQGNTLSAMKSPVLRDRTNTTNELVKVDAPTKTREASTNDKKQVVKTTVKRHVVNKKKVQNENATEQTVKLPEKVEVIEKHTIGDSFKKIILRKNSNSLKVKQSEKNIQLSDHDGNTENKELHSENKIFRRKNISTEVIKQLLNEDEEIDFVSEKKNSQKRSSKVENIIDDFNTEIVKDNKNVKKFFKNKDIKEDVNTHSSVKKSSQGKSNKRKKDTKKIDADDSSFSPAISKESIKTPTYNVRSRVNKNYCELSVLCPKLDINEDKKDAVKGTDINKDLKKVPIYKTIKISQENVKDKEEIYDYLDDSQENTEQRGKKRKRTVKKPTVKRVRKAVTFKKTVGQKVEKKIAKKVPNNVQSKEINKKPINTQQATAVNNVQVKPTDVSKARNSIETNVELTEFSKQIIPKHLLNAGDSTIAEASTIKILSDEKLEGSHRINLTSTPPIPKTITSELKLFGPKNVITLKPTEKYKNMVNHSLIRKSMSPITKVAENFDTGSPWRAIDAFSRVNRIVQSTPQINRLPSMREKKLPTHLSDLNKMSLNSEDTIHISSIMEDKPSKKQNLNEASPRKFGTVISNLSPVKSVNNSNSPVQNNLQPLVQTSSPAKASSEIPIGQIDTTVSLIHNKENTHTSPVKSPRKKINTPSPFRFDKLRSSKKLASSESQSKTPKSIAQENSEEAEPEAGPSCFQKSKSTVLRQSNLNNFLNLDEVPECTRISTGHGIFDDVLSTPISGKKPKCLTEEPNIDNAFGFDDCEINETTSVKDKSSGSMIATAQDIKDSVKGKLFPKARVKSFMPSRITENTIKKTLLRNVITKKKSEKKEPEIFNESEESCSEKENETTKRYVGNNNEYKKSPKEVALDAVSFSDTFDVLSENGEIQSKVPEEIPLFVDLEPVHFTKPPRRSYNKRKRAVTYNTSRDDFDSDEEEYEQHKSKKKKVSKLNKEENKRMQEWLKNINKTFEEIDHYDLVIE